MWKLDSATAANTAILLGAQISWALVGLVVASVGLVVASALFLAVKRGLIPKVMDSVMDFVLEFKKNNASTALMAKTIADIRTDQLDSNRERREHGARIDALEEVLKNMPQQEGPRP